MSYLPYPPDRYDGATGETNAWIRPDATPGEISREGLTARYLATGEATGGDFGLYRWEMGPRRGGPDPHFHRSISESFYVLDGTVMLHDGNGWVEGHRGDFFHVPPGGVHGFRNESDAPASMLLLFTPGAPREDYFERVHTVGSMSPDDRDEFFARHDTFWVSR